MNPTKTKPRNVLSTFALVMITVGSVDSIRNLPATALFGNSLIFFFCLAAIGFLIPSALISGELSSIWAEEGGIYLWVKKAFGKQLGFLAIWCQWIENVFWYPTILSFVAGTLGYLIAPALADNKLFLVTTILCAFWGTTFINLKGMQFSSRFSNFCGIVGLLLPMTLIISLGTIWFATGHPLQISFHPHDLIPHFNDSSIWVSLTGIMFSFCGVEIATIHSCDVKNPQREFPKALIYSSIIILITLVLGSLTIAMVLPHEKISLVVGIMQAYSVFLHNYHLNWMLPLMAVFLIIGALGGVSNWIIAPVRGILIASKEINLPQRLQHHNKFQAPSVLLISQAVIVSFLSLAFLLMPSVNGCYWLLTALASQLYMVMYILMFAAGIRLRYLYPAEPRLFRVPGGNIGMWIVGLLGIASALITLCVGFIPPAGIQVGSKLSYQLLITSGLILMLIPPLFTISLRKSRFKLLPISG